MNKRLSPPECGPLVFPEHNQACCTEREVDALLRELFPVPRSLSGPANRETLRILQKHVPLQIRSYPSGAQVYDWRIPPEWRVAEAWLAGPDGVKLLDYKINPLHLVGYSVPTRGTFSLAELRPHLHWREALPAAIPYRTSYYKQNWGFCLSYEQYLRDFAVHPEDALFTVHVDTELTPGALDVGELVISGQSKSEVLLSTYFCHPNLANDNLSGVVLTAFLARELLRRKNRYSYRVLFVPETIGAIAYCAHNEATMRAIDAGFVITCVAGKGPWGYKACFNPEHRLNRIVEETFAELSIHPLRYPFDTHGSVERQYASPAFRINTVSICKDKYYEYPEYHCSLDDLSCVSARALSDTLQLHLRAIEKLEAERFYRSANPACEVMLSPRGLYPDGGGGMMPGQNSGQQLDSILWLMMLMDGHTSIQDAAARTGLPLDTLIKMAEFLSGQGLLAPLDGPDKKL